MPFVDGQILTAAELNDLENSIAGKAAASHTHAISQVSGLDSALAGKAAASHTHAISQVSGLDSALAGKAAASHTHSASQISDLTAATDQPISNSYLKHSSTSVRLTRTGKIVAACGGIYANGSVAIAAYTSTTIGTVPAGYRPVRQVVSPSRCFNNIPGYLVIAPSGTTTFYPTADINAPSGQMLIDISAAWGTP